MRVLLINPWQMGSLPMISLGYLKAYIKKHKPSVEVSFADEVTYSEIKGPFDIIGFSIHTAHLPNAIRILDFLKAKFPDANFIAGGHHPSALPEQMLEIGFNQVVIGPGGNAFLSIIEGNTADILDYRGDNIDLDIISDYDDQGAGSRVPGMTQNLGWKRMPILSSIGCPFSCSFCASSEFWKRKWTPRSAESVVEEMLYRLNTGRASSFIFSDDNLTLKKNRAVELCELIKEKVLVKYPKLEWQCGSRTESLIDQDLCKSLYSAGCRWVWLGIESGSQKLLDSCSKGLRKEKQFEGIEEAYRNKLKTVGQFIVGLIGETEDTISETINFINSTHITNPGCNTAWLLPNTYFHSYALERGFNNDRYLTEGAPFFTYENSIETLVSWTKKIMRKTKVIEYVT